MKKGTKVPNRKTPRNDSKRLTAISWSPDHEALVGQILEMWPVKFNSEHFSGRSLVTSTAIRLLYEYLTWLKSFGGETYTDFFLSTPFKDCIESIADYRRDPYEKTDKESIEKIRAAFSWYIGLHTQNSMNREGFTLRHLYRDRSKPYPMYENAKRRNDKNKNRTVPDGG